MNIINTPSGSSLVDMFASAIVHSMMSKSIISFKFNGIMCHIKRGMSYKRFERDYHIALLFDIKDIGYGHKLSITKSEIKRKSIEKEIEHHKRSVVYHSNMVIELEKKLEKLSK